MIFLRKVYLVCISLCLVGVFLVVLGFMVGLLVWLFGDFECLLFVWFFTEAHVSFVYQ